jgi:hypothetical protein
MKSMKLFAALCPLLLFAAPPIDIGTRRQLFVDRYLIESTQGVELRLSTPVDAGPAMLLDKPWEGAFSGYFTVIQDGALLRLYYRGEPHAGKDGNAEETTCYAESRDGAHWTKPELGLYEVAGTRKNNAVLAGDPPFSHNFSPMLDTRPGAAAGERYKALAGVHKSGLYAFASADGLRWRKLANTPVLTSKAFAFDSQNVSFWSEAERLYVCYFRTWKRVGAVNYRWVSRTTSRDYIHWEAPVEMNYGDAPPEHLYTNQTSPYFRASDIYVGISARFMPGRQVITAEQAAAIGVTPGYFKDCSDAVLISSRGGQRYDRTFLEAFLRPGLGVENWVSRSNYPALNLVQTGPAEMSFYVVRNYGQPSSYLRRYALRLDGFASAKAPYSGGELVTKPLRFRGRQLELNFATSAPGGIRIEIQDENGVPIPGFTLAESRELIGDEIARAVTWTSGAGLGGLAGKSVQLRFKMHDADVFSLRFRD